MSIYIALLRGLNVGGVNQIKMTELRRMCEAMGLGRVQTYIQSGNVLFETAEEPEPLRLRIEQEITAVFGLSVPVVLRTAVDLEQIIAKAPFSVEGLQEGETLHVSLLAAAPSQEGIDRGLAVNAGVDECRIVGREVYLLFRQPSHKSKLANLERKLGVVATTRNWQTITKLAALARAMAL